MAADETGEEAKEEFKKAAANMEEKMKESEIGDTVLAFLSAAEKKRVLQTASALCIRDKKRLHVQLINYRNAIAEWKRKEKEARNQRRYPSRYNKANDEPAFLTKYPQHHSREPF